MTRRRPPADADEDTLIMRRPHFGRTAAKRPAWRSPGIWLGLVALAILVGGGAAWVLRGSQPSTQPSVAATSVAAPQAASVPQQTASASQQAAPAPQQAPSAAQQAILP